MSTESVETDPHGIVPPEFIERFDDAETVREALELAEKAPSTTPIGLRDRCPSCGGTRVRVKISTPANQPARRSQRMKCWRSECGAHFDEPAAPLVEVAIDPRSIADPTEPTGDELRTIRAALDMSMGEVADRSGWSLGTISKLEKGEPLQSPRSVREAVLDVYRDEWCDLFDRPTEMSRLFAFLFADGDINQ